MMIVNGISQYLAKLWDKFRLVITEPENAVVVMDLNHWGIHNGDFYSCIYFIENLASEGTFTMLIKIGDDDIHMKPVVVEADEEKFLIEYYEDPTVTLEGTEIPIYNKNRNSDKASSTQFFISPTVSDEGTLIDSAYATGGHGVATTSIGTNVTTQSEWFLKSNTYYYAIFYNNGDAAGNYNIKHIWGERTV